MQKEFLGKGMKFPPQINPATGRFVTVDGAQAIKESIYLILMTAKTALYSETAVRLIWIKSFLSWR